MVQVLTSQAAEAASLPLPRFELAQARALVGDLSRPRHVQYWLDLGASVVVGWSLFLLSLRSPLFSAGNLALFALSIPPFYRALTFLHPITHLIGRQKTLIKTFFNLFCGFPFLVPHFFYEGSHVVHHRRSRYGRAGDPEYIAFAKLPRARIFLFLSAGPPTFLFLLLRFMIVGPMSFLIPPLRSWLIRKGSTFNASPQFERVPPTGRARVDCTLQELGCTLVLWLIFIAAARGWIPHQAFLQMVMIWTIGGTLNVLQFLGIHRYLGPDDPHTIESQLIDSVNTPGRLPWITAMWAPVGQRFHALHHVFPMIPYHSLPEAHRRLMRGLPPESIYRGSESGGYFCTFVELWRRSGSK